MVWNSVDMTDDMMEWFFTHLRDLGMQKKKRIYIGPGRDGSSYDKISVDLKFDPLNTYVIYNRLWRDTG